MPFGRKKSLMDRAHDYVEQISETVIPQLEQAWDQAVANGIETIDKDTRAGKVSREIQTKNEQFKKDVMQSLRNLRAGLVALQPVGDKQHRRVAAELEAGGDERPRRRFPHPAGGAGSLPVRWGAADPGERGPVVATLNNPGGRNAIGFESAARSPLRSVMCSQRDGSGVDCRAGLPRCFDGRHRGCIRGCRAGHISPF